VSASFVKAVTSTDVSMYNINSEHRLAPIETSFAPAPAVSA
jgi:hypothetical protein